MSDISNEALYNGSDIASKLNISESTLRKYSQEVEKSGWKFRVNERRARVFTEKDIELFTEFLKLRNEMNMSVEKSSDMSVRFLLPSVSLTHDVSSNDTNDLATIESLNIAQEVRYFTSHLEEKNESNHTELKDELQELKKTMNEMAEAMAENNNKTLWQRIFNK